MARKRSRSDDVADEIRRQNLRAQLRAEYDKHVKRRGATWPVQVYVPAFGTFYIHESGEVESLNVRESSRTGINVLKNPRRRVRANPRALNPWSIVAAMKSGERGTEFEIDARTPITWIVSRQKIGPRHYGYMLPDTLTQSPGFKAWMGANSALEIHGSFIEVKRHFENMMLKKNPAPRSGNAEPEVKQAAKLFQAFTGHRVTTAKRVAPPRHKAAIAVGPVLAVAYETVRDGKVEQYLHKFRRGARPTLAASADGRSLLMLGGAFRFTERGIVDK